MIFVAELSFAIKSFTTQNQKQREIDNEILAKKINDGRIFTPKINNPLDDVIEIIDDPNAEHKKTTFLMQNQLYSFQMKSKTLKN